jgi:hypothetical protein
MTELTELEDARDAELPRQGVTGTAQSAVPLPRASVPLQRIVPATGCECGGDGGACTCGTTASPSYVYAIGTVTARFPSLNIEKEFMQAWGKAPTAALTITDADKFAVLSQGQNLYLAREMCWVFQSQDIDIYILRPRSYVELTDLVMCLAPTQDTSYSLIVGTLGPLAPPSVCNGVQLPIVTCDQVFSFTRTAFINSIVAAVGSQSRAGNGSTASAEASGQTGAGTPAVTGTDAATNAATNAFRVMTLLADNTGQTDEHRAINYLTFKSSMLYATEIEMEAAGFTLNSVAAQPDPLSGTRAIQDVILLYANTSTTQTQRYFTRVDVTGEYPFLINDIARFYDHP